MRRPTRRETLLGGLLGAIVVAGLLPERSVIGRAEAFRALLGDHVPPGGAQSWEEIAEAFFGYDGEALRICREVSSGLRLLGPADPLACLARPEPGIEALEALRRRAIEFVAFGTDLLAPERAADEPVRFIGVPDPMSGRFCNPVARFDEGAESVRSG